MPIISRDAAAIEEGYPGVPRAVLVDASHGSQSLWIGHLEVLPGATITTHIHPDTEEAMTIVEGELEAVCRKRWGTKRSFWDRATRCWPPPASSTGSSTAPTPMPPFWRCSPRPYSKG